MTSKYTLFNDADIAKIEFIEDGIKLYQCPSHPPYVYLLKRDLAYIADELGLQLIDNEGNKITTLDGLEGEKRHLCPDMGNMAIDETFPYEFSVCECFNEEE